MYPQLVQIALTAVDAVRATYRGDLVVARAI
jgi:hypothetical protein